MTTPEEYYDKAECGENEYELYTDVHEVLEEHSVIWAAEPRYVLMSAVEGLFECYFESKKEMWDALDLIGKQIAENSDRPMVADQ